MIEEFNITVVKLKSKNNKNIKYQYINSWITIKMTKQNYDPFYPPYKFSCSIVDYTFKGTP